jgi:hypothetical protein
VAPKALVFVDHQPDAQTELRRLTPFEALLGIRHGGFWVEHDYESISEFLAWVERIDRYTLRYSRIDEASDAIGRLLAERSIGGLPSTT